MCVLVDKYLSLFTTDKYMSDYEAYRHVWFIQTGESYIQVELIVGVILHLNMYVHVVDSSIYLYFQINVDYNS